MQGVHISIFDELSLELSLELGLEVGPGTELLRRGSGEVGLRYPCYEHNRRKVTQSQKIDSDPRTPSYALIEM